MNSNRQKKEYNNILTVSGTGRNTGKTTFVCKLIEKFKDQNCIAVKISSHFHEISPNANFIVNKKNYQVILENDIGKKDSQKMRVAGAEKVYYVQSKDEFLPEVLKYIGINSMQPYIFESGAIAKYLPGSLHVCFAGGESYKPCRKPDFTLRIGTIELDSFFESISFEKNKFTIYVDS